MDKPFRMTVRYHPWPHKCCLSATSCFNFLSHLLPSVVLGGLKDHLKEIMRCKRLIMIGCGTSFHAAVAVSRAIILREKKFWCLGHHIGVNKNNAVYFRAISRSMRSNRWTLLLIVSKILFGTWCLNIQVTYFCWEAALPCKKSGCCRMSTIQSRPAGTSWDD